MSEFRNHAEKLVKDFKQKRMMVLSKRRKLTENTEEDRIKKVDNYQKGLEYISSDLISALEVYKEVFSNLLPEVSCTFIIRSKYPEDLDVTFSIKNHSIRFLSRIANKGEEFQRVLIDGMLYAESTYQGSNRKMETQVGLWSDMGIDAWGMKSEDDKFLYFLKDILPELMENIWVNATLALLHSH